MAMYRGVHCGPGFALFKGTHVQVCFCHRQLRENRIWRSSHARLHNSLHRTESS